MITRYTNSKGVSIEIAKMHPSHMRSAAAKIMREEPDLHETAAALSAAADVAEAQWAKDHPDEA